jgi:hypothetical protein
MPRFIDSTGNISKARASGSRSGSLSHTAGTSGPEDTEATVRRLTEAVKAMSDRIRQLEERQSPDWIEYSVTFNNVTNKLYLAHQFGGPVRWYATYVNGADISTITVNSESTDNVLVLTTSGTGSCIIRVEPSQFSTR